MNTKQEYVYVIYHTTSNRYYIGSRFGKGCHPSDLMRTYFTSSKLVHELIERDGLESFRIIAVRECEEGEALKLETRILTRWNISKSVRWMNYHNNGTEFYNKGHTEATKSKMREAKKGVPKSDEARKNMSEVRKGAYYINNGVKTVYHRGHSVLAEGWVYGRLNQKKHSEETRKKLSEAGMGRTFTMSEESKQRISDAKKGTKASEETRRKLSESHKGRIHSEETKKKLSESKMGKKRDPDCVRRMIEGKTGSYWVNDGVRSYMIKGHTVLREGYEFGRLKKQPQSP